MTTTTVPTVVLDPIIDPRAMPLIEALQAFPGTHEFEAYLNEHGVTYVLLDYGESFRDLARFANKLGRHCGCAAVEVHWGGIPKRKGYIQVSVVPGQMAEVISVLADILPKWS